MFGWFPSDTQGTLNGHRLHSWKLLRYSEESQEIHLHPGRLDYPVHYRNLPYRAGTTSHYNRRLLEYGVARGIRIHRHVVQLQWDGQSQGIYRILQYMNDSTNHISVCSVLSTDGEGNSCCRQCCHYLRFGKFSQPEWSLISRYRLLVRNGQVKSLFEDSHSIE